MSFTPSAAKGSKIEVNNVNGSFVVVEGASAIPRFGKKPAWIESAPINATAKYYAADIPDPGELEIVGERQKTDPGQASLLAWANGANTALQTTQLKMTFSTGDIANVTVVVGGFEMSADQGQMVKFYVPCKISGDVSWS